MSVANSKPSPSISLNRTNLSKTISHSVSHRRWLWSYSLFYEYTYLHIHPFAPDNPFNTTARLSLCYFEQQYLWISTARIIQGKQVHLCIKLSINNYTYVYSYAVKVDKMTVIAVSNFTSIVTAHSMSLIVQAGSFTSSPIVCLFLVRLSKITIYLCSKILFPLF